MPNNVHTVPKTERERRMRWLQLQRIEMGEIDPPNAKHPTPKHLSAAARRRVVEVLHLEAGLPLPQWGHASHRDPADLIDVAPLKAAWDALRRDRGARFEALGLALENGGGRVRCRRCRATLLDVPSGMIGVTPTALYVMHAQETGCR